MTEGNNFNFFNEEKARRLVKYLLEKDIKSYKKLIPEIESLNSEKLKNYFKE
jgi:ribosomal protein S15P/S13E